MSCGKVWLVGAGPGAPDLLTVRALRCLQQAEVVFHDALVHPGTLAVAARARHVAVGKRCGAHSTSQRFIHKRLIDAARKHRCVVRLKGGDPMLFGRAQEEIEALNAAGVPWEVVPGITAALAAAAELGVSLTRRGVSRSVTFATPRTGHDETATDWAHSVADADTGALYMAAGAADATARSLQEAGLPAATPVMVCENVSLTGARYRRTQLDRLSRQESAPGQGPVLLLVGEVFADAAAVPNQAPELPPGASVAAGGGTRR